MWKKSDQDQIFSLDCHTVSFIHKIFESKLSMLLMHLTVLLYTMCSLLTIEKETCVCAIIVVAVTVTLFYKTRLTLNIRDAILGAFQVF